MYEIPLEWIVGNALQEDYVLELALIDGDGNSRRRYYYEIVPGVSVTAWQAGKRHVGHYPLPLDRLLPAGTYRLSATLTPVGRERETLLSAEVGALQVVSNVDTVSVVTSASVVNVNYGVDLRLLDYNLDVGSDTIHLTLRWQAVQPMTVDYKFFLHLYAPEDDTVVAQEDTMPHNWTYPTSRWGVDRLVEDEITLSLGNVQTGTYRLGIGVYNPQTGERLSVTHLPAQFTASEGRLFLPEEIKR